MARASTPTLLSLDRFAKILGINPVHFNGGAGASVWVRNGACDETWVQHPWQTMRTISREELAREIAGAEDEISKYLKWDVAPRWHMAEEYRWPESYMRNENYPHYDARRNQPSVILDRGKIIAGGRRAWSVIEASATVVYSDEDSDGYDETATITSATTLTDTSEIKLYSDVDHQGNPAWEIRPVRSISISGGNVTIVVDAWQLFVPALWEAFPTATEFPDIDITQAANYVATVDVLRVYNDVTEVSSQLQWRSSCLICGGSGCAACSPATQDGCLGIINSELGEVVPKPAAYTDGAWKASTWDAPTRPEIIRFWYYSGNIGDNYKAGWSSEQLDDYWAEAVAWLTAARLTRPLCSCDSVMQMVNMMQTDMLLNKRDTGARFIPADSYVHKNPFGFRYGEVRAWLRVKEAMRWYGSAT